MLDARQDARAAELRSEFDALIAESSDWLARHTSGTGELRFERFAEMRYLGQEHTIRVPVREEDFAPEGLATLRRRFDEVYEKAYAHALPDHELEFVILRLVATGPIERPPILPRPPGDGGTAVPSGSRTIYVADRKHSLDCALFDRDRLDPGVNIGGPAIIEEWSTTILVLADQAADVDRFGNLSITETP